MERDDEHWRRLVCSGRKRVDQRAQHHSARVTGAVTASGGAWNASIVAEVVSWGSTTLRTNGLGAYIAEATSGGDWPRISLGIGR